MKNNLQIPIDIYHSFNPQKSDLIFISYFALLPAIASNNIVNPVNVILLYIHFTTMTYYSSKLYVVLFRSA